MCKHGKYKLMNMEVEIDECLVPLIKILQEHGIKTRACCCGHNEKHFGRRVNNHLILSLEGAKVGIRNKNGVAVGWKDPSDFNMWGVSIPIEKKS